MTNISQTPTSPLRNKRRKSISYAKWGYIFILPFFIVYLTCTLVPQFLTVYNSFFRYMRTGLKTIGPEWIGLENYEELFEVNRRGYIPILKFARNTMTMWLMGAIPQIVVALVLAVWFTSYRLNIKGQAFFKTVIYMPNLIMASAFSMLFYTLFSPVGPVNQVLQQSGMIDQPIEFFQSTITVRSLIALMNFLMWFGNTTILLMAGIMGIDQSIFEAATIDGATSLQVFFKVTLPLLMPILLYTVITAMIGGIQMFDVPNLLTEAGTGNPDNTSKTLIMYLNDNLYYGTKNYGVSGAISVVIFLMTGILSIGVFKTMAGGNAESEKKKMAKNEKKLAKKKGVRV